MRRGLILLKPVDQTETDPGRGNCLTACLASIMDLGIDEVPYFRVYDDWWELLQEWLRGHGLFAIRVSACPDEVFPTPDVHCILTGLSPRNSVIVTDPDPTKPSPIVQHSVVGIWRGKDTCMVHDPHPDRTGLAGPVDFVTFLGKLV